MFRSACLFFICMCVRIVESYRKLSQWTAHSEARTGPRAGVRSGRARAAVALVPPVAASRAECQPGCWPWYIPLCYSDFPSFTLCVCQSSDTRVHSWMPPHSRDTEEFYPRGSLLLPFYSHSPLSVLPLHPYLLTMLNWFCHLRLYEWSRALSGLVLLT